MARGVHNKTSGWKPGPARNGGAPPGGSMSGRNPGPGRKPSVVANGARSIKRRYQKGETGAGAIHRRRLNQYKSGKVTGIGRAAAKDIPLGIVHTVSYANHLRTRKRRR